VPDRAHPVGAQAGPPKVLLDPLGRVPACDLPGRLLRYSPRASSGIGPVRASMAVVPSCPVSGPQGPTSLLGPGLLSTAPVGGPGAPPATAPPGWHASVADDAQQPSFLPPSDLYGVRTVFFPATRTPTYTPCSILASRNSIAPPQPHENIQHTPSSPREDLPFPPVATT